MTNVPFINKITNELSKRKLKSDVVANAILDIAVGNDRLDNLIANGVTQSDLESLTIGGLTTEQTEALGKIEGLEASASEIDGNIPKYNNTNRVDNSDYNFCAPDLVACVVMGGTSSQPNRIGVKTLLTTITCDGINNVYEVSLGFTSTQVKNSDLIIVADLADGTRNPIDGVQRTFVGNGTGSKGYTNATSLTITTSLQVAGTILNVYVLSGEVNLGTNAYLQSVSGGYNAVSNKLMSHVIGSAHSIIDGTDGNGHNAILGGSYNAVLNSTYCSMVSGSRSLIDTSGFSSVVGGENYIKNSIGSFASGYRNYISGNYSTCFGTKNKVTALYALGRGRDSITQIAGAETVGHRENFQTTRASFNLTTTNATKGVMKDSDNGTLQKVRDGATIRVYGKVTALETATGSVKTFDVDSIMKTLNGASTLIKETITTVFSSANTSSWTVAMQPSNNSFYIRPTGEDGKTIRWFATLEIQEIY